MANSPYQPLSPSPLFPLFPLPRAQNPRQPLTKAARGSWVRPRTLLPSRQQAERSGGLYSQDDATGNRNSPYQPLSAPISPSPSPLFPLRAREHPMIPRFLSSLYFCIAKASRKSGAMMWVFRPFGRAILMKSICGVSLARRPDRA